jgi:hypothetical protein
MTDYNLRIVDLLRPQKTAEKKPKDTNICPYGAQIE